MKKIILLVALFVAPQAFAATMTFSPAAGDRSPADGLSWSSEVQTWDQARNNTKGSYSSATDNAKAFLNGYKVGDYTELLRSMRCYPTSGLPDDAVISAASETLYMYSDNHFTYDYYGGSYHLLTDRVGSQDYFALVDYNGATNTITNADYDNFGLDRFSNNIKFSSLKLDADNVVQLNADGIRHINKTGTTCFGMRDGYDLDNVPYPDGTNFALWGNDAGVKTVVDTLAFIENKPPRLSITYTSKSTATPQISTTVSPTPIRTGTPLVEVENKSEKKGAILLGLLLALFYWYWRNSRRNSR